MDRRYNRPEAIDQITAKAATWAQEHEIPFIHTSARTPMNVCEAFQLALSLSHQTQSSDRPVSIGLLGSGGVGKSSLRLRYTMGVFVNNYVRLGGSLGFFQLISKTGSHNRRG